MSYQVIARKYRPQLFDDVIGQQIITDTLKNAILHDRVAHGYIFSGARGIGKTTTARILAKAINCAQGPTVKPCGECPSCREIAVGSSVDVLEIDAASNRGIDEIRELRETVRYLPARDRYKVFIIDEAHMLTTEAFNALLKTLEEPPPRSLFILATTESHKLPPTIRSRCQHFAFRLLDYTAIHSRLEWVAGQEGTRADEAALSAITQAAEGSLRDALSLLDQVIAACGDHLETDHVQQLLGVVPSRHMAELIRAIHAGDAGRVLEQVSHLEAEGFEPSHFCSGFTHYVRNLMIAKSCSADSSLLQVPHDERPTLRELAALFSEEDLTRFVQVLLRSESELRYSLQPRFHLELSLLKLVHARRLASLETFLGEFRAQLSTEGQRPTATRPEAKPAITSSQPEPPPLRPAPAQPSPDMPPGSTAPAAAMSSPLEVEDTRLAAIKTHLFEQSNKFLSSCLDHLSGWRYEAGEAHFTFGKKESWAADFLKTRERQDALRTACEAVLGQPVRIYVTLETGSLENTPARANVRERVAKDPAVEEIRRRFDCTVADVKDQSTE